MPQVAPAAASLDRTSILHILFFLQTRGRVARVADCTNIPSRTFFFKRAARGASPSPEKSKMVRAHVSFCRPPAACCWMRCCVRLGVPGCRPACPNLRAKRGFASTQPRHMPCRGGVFSCMCWRRAPAGPGRPGDWLRGLEHPYWCPFRTGYVRGLAVSALEARRIAGGLSGRRAGM